MTATDVVCWPVPPPYELVMAKEQPSAEGGSCSSLFIEKQELLMVGADSCCDCEWEYPVGGVVHPMP